MNVWEFEEAVWEVERIRIVIRAPADEVVDDYNYEHAREGNHTLAILRDARIRPRIGDREVIAIDGEGQVVNGAKRLRNLRDSYGQ